MNNPLITHLILTYNDFHYLRRIIDLSLHQINLMAGQKQILIVDDGSKEPVEPKLKELYNFKKSNIKVIRNKKNVGINVSIEIGLNNVYSTYVHLGSSNDILTPTFFSESVKVLEDYKEASFSFSDPGTFEENKNIYKNFPLYLSTSPIYFSPIDFCKKYKQKPFHIGSNTILFRTNDLKKVGIQKDLKIYGDWFLSYFLAFSTGCAYIPKNMTYLTLHKNAFSNSFSYKNKKEEVTLFLEKFQKMNSSAFSYLQKSGFASSFPFQIILTLFFTQKNVGQYISTYSLVIGFIRFIWGFFRTILPVRMRNKMRKLKTKLV